MVVKPCKQSEIDFYQSTKDSHPSLIPFIPTFNGTITLGADSPKAQAAGVIVLPDETNIESPAGSGIGSTAVISNDWIPSNGGKIHTDLGIVLENVAHGYKKPNILDVKLGARLWDDDAPPAKRAKLDAVAEDSTSQPLGFRIAGMKTYKGASIGNQNGITSEDYNVYDKLYGHSFTVDNIVDGFRDYFLLGQGTKPIASIRKVINRFIDQLKEIEDVIKAEESRMYSASLLFVYEGDTQTLQYAFVREKNLIESLHNGELIVDGKPNGHEFSTGENTDSESTEEEQIKFPDIQSLKLIDFAHARWTPGEGSDRNLLYGIDNVIETLRKLPG